MKPASMRDQQHRADPASRLWTAVENVLLLTVIVALAGWWICSWLATF